MNGTPLTETGDAKLVARGFLLGQKIAANVVVALTLADLEHWERNLPAIPDALRRGFGIEPEAPSAEPTPRPSFAFADTNAAEAIKEAEDFAEKFFGARPDLRKQFTMPETLPWKDVIVVYDPGTLTNRMAVDQALKAQKCLQNVYEESAVEHYSGSEASGKPTLRFVERSGRPTSDTMGMSANEMVATKRTFLDLRGYAIAFGTYHKATLRFLDSKTWTRFPNNRLQGGGVVSAGWHPRTLQVSFSVDGADSRSGFTGAREAVECSLAVA